MSGYVVDASVALKWYLPEPHSERARRLRDNSAGFDAPDLLYAEVGSALWKRVRRAEITSGEAAEIAAALSRMPIDAHPARLLGSAALQIACATGLTVYDSLYAATALLTERPLVTADRRFHEVARRAKPLRDRVLWIGDLPA